MKPLTMRCRACDGTGHVSLPAEMLNTMALLRRGPITAPELRQYMPEGSRSATAANNRLEVLRQLGFVERRKEARRWVYSLRRSP